MLRVGETPRDGKACLFEEGSDGFQLRLLSGQIPASALRFDACDQTDWGKAVFEVEAKKVSVSQSRLDSLDPARSSTQEFGDFSSQFH